MGGGEESCIRKSGRIVTTTCTRNGSLKARSCHKQGEEKVVCVIFLSFFSFSIRVGAPAPFISREVCKALSHFECLFFRWRESRGNNNNNIIPGKGDLSGSSLARSFIIKYNKNPKHALDRPGWGGNGSHYITISFSSDFPSLPPFFLSFLFKKLHWPKIEFPSSPPRNTETPTPKGGRCFT